MEGAGRSRKPEGWSSHPALHHELWILESERFPYLADTHTPHTYTFPPYARSRLHVGRSANVAYSRAESNRTLEVAVASHAPRTFRDSVIFGTG